jgi:ABC-type dipeptide/oligopeptide/nickel transport system ATPase component
MAMLIISHNLGVVAELCDRIYVMRAGKVVESGDTLEIFENPKHPYTAQLVELSTGRNAAPVGSNVVSLSEESRPGAA